MNLVFLYYDNPKMLETQIHHWNAYKKTLGHVPRIILVDDGSPKTFAAHVVQRSKPEIPIEVYRIKEDIPWNFTGARNLGCFQADEWIYMSDIDTLLFPEDAKKLFEGRPLHKQQYYIPKRVWLPDLKVASVGNVNLLFHKDKYLEVGGYDEDYAGFYGRGDTDFHHRLKKILQRVYRDDVMIRVVPPSLIADARTRGMKRDKTNNIALYESKKAAGFINPVNPLRFSWKRVL